MGLHVVDEPTQASVTVPRSVRLAAQLTYLWAALDVLNTVLAWLLSPQLHQTPVSIMVGVGIGEAVVAGIAIFLANRLLQLQSWARTMIRILAALQVLSLLLGRLSNFQVSTGYGLFDVLLLLIDIALIYLLSTRSANAVFARRPTTAR